MPVTDNPFAALVVDQIGVAFDKDLDFGLNSLHQHPPRSLSKSAEQRIIVDNPAWSRQTNNITLVHGGVSFQTVISSITKDTPPNHAYTKFSYRPPWDPESPPAEKRGWAQTPRIPWTRTSALSG